MNSRKSTLTVALALLCAALAAAQTGTPDAASAVQLSSDSPWHLIFFPRGDQNATESINQAIRAGYIPVGLEITAGESLGILLVKSSSLVVQSWAILDYTDWNALEGEITGGIQDGFVPMDISRYEETLAVLWVRSDVAIDGWRISTSPNTINDRTRTLNDFQSQGFTLWGMSAHEGLAWYLFLRQPGMPPAGAISGFRKDGNDLQADMVDASREGWAPNGLASNESTIYICFVR